MSRAHASRWMAWVILGAFALRCLGLDHQELRGDEAFGYFFSLQSLGEIYRQTLALAEPHPPASYWLQHGWLGLAGHAEFALRWPSLWAGTLAVALIYRLGRELRLPGALGVAAASLLAASPYTIWHSQDARMYSLSLALTLASMVLAVKWLGAPRRAVGGGYVAVSLLALHTHYFTAFVLAAQTVYVLAAAVGKQMAWRRAGQWLALQALVGLLYVPWLIAAAGIVTGYGGNGDSPGLMEAFRRALGAMVTGGTWPQETMQSWAWVALSLVALGGWWLYTGMRRQALLLLGIYLALPLALTWLASVRRPIFDERYLVAATPPLYLLAAAALGPLYDVRRERGYGGRLALQNVAAAASILLVVVAMAVVTASLTRYYGDPAYGKTRGWRELAVSLERWGGGLPRGSVRISQNYPDPTLWYYYRGPDAHLVLPPGAGDAAGAEREVAALAKEGVRVVLLALQAAATWDADGLAARTLAERYNLAGTLQAGGWPVAVYTLPPETMEPKQVTFANQLELLASGVEPTALTPGGLLLAHLVWRGENAHLTGDEQVSVQLLDRDGKLVAQQDRPLPGGMDGAAGTGGASYVILVPEELTAGPYRLIAVVYNPKLPGAPRILTSDGRDHVVLGEFEVVNNSGAGAQNADVAP